MRIPYRLLASIGLATAGLAAMADPAPVLFGGWRNLATAADAGYVEENMAFAMLPAVVARGTRMAVLDEQRKQTVCCLEVVSVPLEDSLLRHRFDLPGVWVSDLRNDWNIDHRPYLPEVFALQRRDALVDYHFDENGYGHLGGLLVPADARITPQGTLHTGSQTFTVDIDTQPMANDNGSMSRYTLTDTRNPQHRYTVEVPVATY